MKSHPATILAIATALVAGGLQAQQLRRAVAAADLVVLARVVRVIPTKTHVIHRLRISEVLRGAPDLVGLTKASAVVTKKLSFHNKPVAAKPMLLCLHRVSQRMQQKYLPAGFAPYFNISGYAGSAVVLGADPKSDPRVAFARALIASQKGQPPRRTAEALFAIALSGDKRVRIEAADSLSERAILQGFLSDMHISNLLTKAAGETDDIPYKIALATICAERKIPALIPTLCISVEHVGDPTFLRALGRFAKVIHKEGAAKAMMPHVRRAKGTTKDRLIYALGATSTTEALETLLAMQRTGEHEPAVEAGLRVHGSRRAAAAIVARKKQLQKKSDESKK